MRAGWHAVPRAIALAAAGSLAFGGAKQAAAADEVALEPIAVTAGRGAAVPAGGTRVTVIGREEIARLPVSSVADAIALIAGADVRQRGPDGVQADLSLRGGTFEQTLVLVNGVKVSDPQTGHHALDLPFGLGDIERIEVLRGPGSRVWGPNAFTGAVNIVTRASAGRSLAAQAQGGAHGSAAGNVELAADAGGFAGRLGLSGSRSDGYRHNTDYEIGSASLGGVVPLGLLGLDVLAGHTEKDFGANGFYSDRYPNQREDTATTFVSLGEDFAGDTFIVSPRLSWRQHRDHYVLDFRTPSLYENRHRTDTLGAELQATLDAAAGVTTFGAEWALERIDSSSLGDHDRSRAGLFGNHRLALGRRASLAAGAFASFHSDWGWEVWPGADVTVDLGAGARLLASVDKSYRVPTYTELYYTSPASVGNPDLVPEEAWTWEAGADWHRGGHRLSAAFFRREGTNLIDWVRADASQPWQVMNVAAVRTDGVELGWEWLPQGSAAGAVLHRLRAGYAYLDTDRDTQGLASRYLLDYLRHQVVLELGHRLGGRLSQSWRVSWEDRLNGEEYLLVDTRIRWPLTRGELFLDVTNLLDASYAFIPGVPQPGRWVTVGARLGFGPW
jgi:iron complex outermembrane receptor protein